PEATILAEQGGLGFAVDGQLFQEHVHSDLEDGVHDGKQAQQEQVGFRTQAGGEQFAKTAAGQAHEHQFAALLFSRADGDHEPDPPPHFPFSQNGHGMADRLNFEGKSKEGRIQVAEQAVTDGGFLLEHFLEFAHVDFRAADHFEQAHVVQATGGNFTANDDFGAAKEISLEIDEPHVTGLIELVGGFEFFRQHLALRPKLAHHASPFLGPGGADVDFKDVGKFAQWQAGIVGCEVVKGDEISSRFQALAGGDDAVFRLNRLQNLGYGLAWRQQSDQISKQDLGGAIHEGEAVIANGLDTEKQGGIEGGAASELRVGVEVIFDTVAEKDFVSEHLLRAVKNWLAGDEALSGQGERVGGRGFLCGSSGFHPFYIGFAAAELQAKLRERLFSGNTWGNREFTSPPGVEN